MAFYRRMEQNHKYTVNVDDAMDDIFHQLKGVSGGARKKVSDSSPSQVTCPPLLDRSKTLSWNEEDVSKQSPSFSTMETSRSHSDDEVHDEDHSSEQINGWHSDNELNSKGFPPRVVKRVEESANLDSQRSQQLDKFDRISLDNFSTSKNVEASDLLEDLVGVPPEDKNDFELSTLPALVPVFSSASGETLLLLVKHAELIINKCKKKRMRRLKRKCA